MLTPQVLSRLRPSDAWVRADLVRRQVRTQVFITMLSLASARWCCTVLVTLRHVRAAGAEQADEDAEFADALRLVYELADGDPAELLDANDQGHDASFHAVEDDEMEALAALCEEQEREEATLLARRQAERERCSSSLGLS